MNEVVSEILLIDEEKPKRNKMTKKSDNDFLMKELIANKN